MAPLRHLLILPWIATATGRLRQLHVITRHGSRLPLVKNGDNLSEGSEGTLTAIGQRQMYDLGVYLASTYDVDFLQQYRYNSVRLESSGYERTISSANALALGLFDPTERDPLNESLLPTETIPIPVFSTQSTDDVVLRAYDKCVAFHDNLADLYKRDDWKELETQNMDLLTRLGGFTAFSEWKGQDGWIRLKDLWNVFDRIQVQKVECDNSSSLQSFTCQLLSSDAVDLSDEEWADLKTLAHQAEILRYGRETAEDFIGGNLLRKIAERATGGDDGFFLYSAHYPTLLGVFAALNIVPPQDEVLPDYASAIIIEVSDSAGSDEEPKIQFLYKPGSESTVSPYPALCLDEPCHARDLLKTVTTSPSKWCRRCGINTPSCQPEHGNVKEEETSAVVGFLAGMGTVISVLVLISCYKKCRRRKRVPQCTPCANDSAAPDPSKVNPTIT